MERKLSCVLIVDDNEGDNFLHELEITEAEVADVVVSELDAQRALTDLREARLDPELILLDLNMPLLDGWGFLEEFARLPAERRSAKIIVMVSMALSDADRARAEAAPCLQGFCEKPITAAMLERLLAEHFADAP